MDIVLIEIILWAGLLFFFWAMKEGLGRVEADIESLGPLNSVRSSGKRAGPTSFSQPECTLEPIGTYGESTIYRYAMIDGRAYQFDRICLLENSHLLDAEERWLSPGLVYQECSLPPELIMER